MGVSKGSVSSAQVAQVNSLAEPVTDLAADNKGLLVELDGTTVFAEACVGFA